MLNRFVILLIIASCCVQGLGAQEVINTGYPGVQKNTWGFSSITQVGATANRGNAGVTLQTINGARYGSWFFGIGAGLDTYIDRTWPLFASVRKSLFRRRNTPFAYAGGGWQIMGEKDVTEKDDPWNWRLYDAGGYYEAGIGYYFGTGKKGAVSLSLGYSRKDYEKTTMSGRYAYHMNRYALQLGYRF